ncbi:glycosyltransferase [Mycobacterium szulgai]|uniref:Glycosyl transferase n=1 Tax=Mycobacterium szulgai TaxID=1787 RepID=A0A1X2E8W7_MYCSZ|nr:glycosyltransferase [Mycobacterium szulgai]MCV7074733.1 glycosyltransferase [Mycobacterium szulgai]ORW96821.1 glycosyl transferase [Mycobacterium szulgai]
MKFVLAVHGTRGDVEPCAAIGLELRRRGHEVAMAVPPNLLGFIESVGLTGVPYGPDSVAQLDEDIFRNPWKVRSPVTIWRQGAEYLTWGWEEMSSTLVSLADGADLLVSGQTYQGVVANVAEHYGIPMAALHHFPHRPNGHLIPHVPAPLMRSTMKLLDWLYWRMCKGTENTQRRRLGLAPTAVSSANRIAEQSLEIQAYDEIYFPGLAAEWGDRRRPFVGVLTLGLPTETDDEVAEWIAAGTPPIYFGWGSMRVDSPADAVAMISDVCAELGERALICSGVSDFDVVTKHDNVKVVSAVNHSAVFPLCRAVVHHGGAGTTAAGMRAGVPTLVLWIAAEQPLWAAQVQRLKVGLARRFPAATRKSLAKNLRTVLAPEYRIRARQVAAQMTKAADSITTTADLLEETARAGADPETQGHAKITVTGADSDSPTRIRHEI